MSQNMGYHSVNVGTWNIVQLLSCKFPRLSIVFSVGFFGDEADVEIAVAPVFVVFVTTTRWMKDHHSQLREREEMSEIVSILKVKDA